MIIGYYNTTLNYNIEIQRFKSTKLYIHVMFSRVVLCLHTIFMPVKVVQIVQLDTI